MSRQPFRHLLHVRCLALLQPLPDELTGLCSRQCHLRARRNRLWEVATQQCRHYRRTCDPAELEVHRFPYEPCGKVEPFFSHIQKSCRGLPEGVFIGCQCWSVTAVAVMNSVSMPGKLS